MRILGIEFGSWGLKAVEMESRFRKLEVLEFHEVRLPLQITDPVTTYKKAMEQLLARLPAHPEKIITALPHNQIALRFINLPIKKRKKVEQMYRFELEDSVPFKLEDSIVEHQVHATKEGSIVVTAMSPKKNILNHISWLREVGVEPDWLCFEGMGLVNLAINADTTSEQENPGPVCVLDVGHTKTSLAIINEGHLEFFRTIPWGGHNINHSLSLNMGVSPEEAEKIKISQLKIEGGTTSDDEDMETSFLQAASPFITDLNHSLIAYRNLQKRSVTSIRVTGGTSRLKNFDGFLEKNLNIPTLKFKPFESLEIKEELKKTADQYRFCEAWGRAVAFGRKAPILFNFRQQELAKQTSLNEVSEVLKNPNIVKLVQYASVLALILFFHVTVASYLADTELSKANDELKKVFQETFRSVNAKTRTELIANPVDLKKFIDKKNNELEQKLKMLSKNKTSMLRLIAGVSNAFPKSIRVDVNDMQIDDTKFTLDGVVYENGNLAPVTEALKKIAAFSEITLQQEGQRFTYRGKVTTQ